MFVDFIYHIYAIVEGNLGLYMVFKSELPLESLRVTSARNMVLDFVHSTRTGQINNFKYITKENIAKKRKILKKKQCFRTNVIFSTYIEGKVDKPQATNRKRTQIFSVYSRIFEDKEENRIN